MIKLHINVLLATQVIWLCLNDECKGQSHCPHELQLGRHSSMEFDRALYSFKHNQTNKRNIATPETAQLAGRAS